MKGWIIPILVIAAASLLAYIIYAASEKTKASTDPYVYGAPKASNDVPGPTLSELNQQATNIPFVSILSITNKV